MHGRYISTRFERFTGAIDINAFERESHGLFLGGVFVGIIVIGLIIPLYSIHTHTIVITTSTDYHPIPVRLIRIRSEVSDTAVENVREDEIPPLAGDMSQKPLPPSAPEQQSASLPKDSESPETIDIKTESGDTLPMVSILHKKPEPVLFSPYRDGAMPETESTADSTPFLTWEDTFHGHPGIIPPSGERQRWETSIPLTENSIVFLSEGYGSIFWDPLNPIEPEPEDERRRFDPTFLGLPAGRGITFAIVPGMVGFNAIGLLSSVQHFVKRMKWQHDDAKAMSNRQALTDAGFIALTEQDIRFLILLWQYKQINPDRLTINDREFLSESESRIITTNRDYLEEMVTRGLAVSLQISGMLVYRAAITRDEMVNNLISAIRYTLLPDSTGSDSLYTDTHTMLDNYINLILSNTESGQLDEVTQGVPGSGLMEHIALDDSSESITDVKDSQSQPIND